MNVNGVDNQRATSDEACGRDAALQCMFEQAHANAFANPILIGRKLSNSSKPILNLQAADSFELGGIGGHDRGADRTGVRGDQQVVAADRLSGRLQF